MDSGVGPGGVLSIHHTVNGQLMTAPESLMVLVGRVDGRRRGDKVVERSSAVATHGGPMLGKPPSRRRVQWTEIHIYRMKDGKIAEHWAEVAMMELLQQIGVLPQLG